MIGCGDTDVENECDDPRLIVKGRANESRWDEEGEGKKTGNEYLARLTKECDEPLRWETVRARTTRNGNRS